MKRWFAVRRPTPVDESSSAAPFGHISTGAPATSDEELLRRFVVRRDDRAFAELVGRHGGLVMGVCRRILGQHQDAEDAFQAVFLVLSRKADALRRAGSLPAWLHRTAFRTALRARSLRVRRREQATEDLSMIAAAEFAGIASDHDRSVVDEELNALPERFRLPIFLCCLEGLSLDEAARQLGWSVGSVKGRLERGRAELRRRLLLRRVPFALGLAALASLAPSTAPASTVVSPSLIAATVQASMQHAAGYGALGYVSQNALTLTRGSWNMMSITATKVVIGIVAATTLGVVGAGNLTASGNPGGGRGLTLEASFAPTADAEFAAQLALADEPVKKRPAEEGVKKPRPEGDAPIKARPEGDAPRKAAPERETPKSRPAEGDVPRKVAPERDNPKARPAEGETPRKVAGGDRPAGLDDFQPQNEREKVLMGMIMQLQRELAELRRMAAARDGVKAPPREGDGVKTGPRDGEVRKEGARDGEVKKEGPRDGEVKKEGARDGEVKKEGPRDGDVKKPTAREEAPKE